MAVQPYADAPALLRDFLYYMLTIKGRSARTVEAYYIDLRTFLRFVVSRSLPGDPELSGVDISHVGPDDLRRITLTTVYEFLNYTLTERDNKAKTRSRKVSSLRSFFKYLTVKENILEENPVKHLEVPAVKKTLPRHLTLEESLELLAHVESAYARRDYCIITLLLNCGMRLSELCGINLSDLRDNKVRLLGKGNKERIVYLNDACLAAIGQYLPERDELPRARIESALFLSARGTRLSPRRVEQIVAECLRKANLNDMGYSPHKLRHTAATLMYQHGHVDIRVLKEILGHVNLGTTELYTHVSNTQIEKAAGKNPLANIKKDSC